ncbi:MAG: tetratricopeptide repeat protein, partial [Leptolyngbyaceae cyanobacterium CAN_BIN12]|nr:tetratricopeptide repeat protein [Leptolyngbyaceae cyanobacterium CAN_BIN12]
MTGISAGVLCQHEAIAQISQQPPPELVPKSAPANPKPSQSKQSPDKRKQPIAEEFPSNPLEITQPDPLIPYDYKNRPLTAQEIRQLRAGANRLAVIGATKLEQGDRVAAFNAWNRELRFRRLAGPLTEEVLTLGRVGDAAWRDSDTTQLRWVTKRLDEILAKAQTEQAASKGQLANPDRLSALETLSPDLALDLELNQPSKITENRTVSGQPQAQTQAPPVLSARQLLDTLDTNPLAVGGVNAIAILGNLNKEVSLLDALGFAYQQVRLPQTAVKVYQQLLAEARRRKDDFKLEATLITLGQLHLAWFDYGSAVQPYQELLARSRSRRDPINFPLY